MNVVEAEGVSKSYGGNEALSDITFTIGASEIFALVGPNGAGKTTLLRILTGILLPDRGRFRLLGSDHLETIRDRIGYLPEERGLYKREKIGETLAYLAELKGLSAKNARARARAVLDQVGMAAHFDSRPEALSKGMAQRVQLAAAFVHDPPFVILDEPFTGLDPVSARQAQKFILDERSQGRTILLSVHQMETVERLCDRLLMLHRGRSILYGTVAEVRSHAATGIVRVEHEEDVLVGVTFLDNVEVVETAPGSTSFALPPAVTPRELLAVLVLQGARITGFHVLQPTLEEIFVGLVAERPIRP